MRQIEHVIYPPEKPFICPVCNEGNCELKRYGFASEDIAEFMEAVERGDLNKIQDFIENTRFVGPTDKVLTLTQRRARIVRAAEALYELACHLEG